MSWTFRKMHCICNKCRFRITVGYGDVIKVKGLILAIFWWWDPFEKTEGAPPLSEPAPKAGQGFSRAARALGPVLMGSHCCGLSRPSWPRPCRGPGETLQALSFPPSARPPSPSRLAGAPVAPSG